MNATSTVIGALAAVAFAGQPAGLPQGSEPVKLDPANFTTRIDNPYWPMRPGSRWVYRETDREGAKQRVVVTVTNRTKRIANGVTARVVHDVVTARGTPVEVTDDWYAQDRAGNIWYLGEHTTEYTNGKPTSTEGSFEAGVDGAQPGVAMPAHPKPGQRYRQEYYKGHAEDRARVLVARNRLVDDGSTSIRSSRGCSSTSSTSAASGPCSSAGVIGSSDLEELVSYRPGR